VQAASSHLGTGLAFIRSVVAAGNSMDPQAV
jgi:hypothetical protein